MKTAAEVDRICYLLTESALGQYTTCADAATLIREQSAEIARLTDALEQITTAYDGYRARKHMPNGWNAEKIIAAIQDAYAAGVAVRACPPREPTEAMLAAVERMRPAVGSPEQLADAGYCERWKSRHRHNAIEIWHAMYDAAIAASKGE